jgi:hypothetical protein
MIAVDMRSRMILSNVLYTSDEAAHLLGLSVRKLWEIPSQELPRTRTGPGGGKVMWYGRNLLLYIRQRSAA